jgi:hypothetical protein
MDVCHKFTLPGCKRLVFQDVGVLCDLDKTERIVCKQPTHLVLPNQSQGEVWLAKLLDENPGMQTSLEHVELFVGGYAHKGLESVLTRLPKLKVLCTYERSNGLDLALVSVSAWPTRTLTRLDLGRASGRTRDWGILPQLVHLTNLSASTACADGWSSFVANAALLPKLESLAVDVGNNLIYKPRLEDLDKVAPLTLTSFRWKTLARDTFGASWRHFMQMHPNVHSLFGTVAVVLSVVDDNGLALSPLPWKSLHIAPHYNHSAAAVSTGAVANLVQSIRILLERGAERLHTFGLDLIEFPNHLRDHLVLNSDVLPSTRMTTMVTLDLRVPVQWNDATCERFPSQFSRLERLDLGMDMIVARSNRGVSRLGNLDAQSRVLNWIEHMPSLEHVTADRMTVTSNELVVDDQRDAQRLSRFKKLREERFCEMRVTHISSSGDRYGRSFNCGKFMWVATA